MEFVCSKYHPEQAHMKSEEKQAHKKQIEMQHGPSWIIFYWKIIIDPNFAEMKFCYAPV